VNGRLVTWSSLKVVHHAVAKVLRVGPLTGGDDTERGDDVDPTVRTNAAAMIPNSWWP